MIIGLCGKRSSGKTSAATKLKELYGYSVYSFAAPIKEALVAMGVHEDVVYHNRNELAPWFGKTGRHLLQTLGTEWGRRHVHEDIWLDLMEKRIVEDHGNLAEAFVVIDDLRFPNEADRVHSWGGYVVEVTRGVRWDDPAERHISEKGVDAGDVDFRLSNASHNLQDLEHAATALLQDIDEKEKAMTGVEV
tara:strand:+ start:46 stop:618 length:573 start_codon:yes stop_codon:yes gene_type:complete